MKGNLVVQTSALIEAHYKQEYSIQEQRTILWIISEIHKDNHFAKTPYGSTILRISAQKYAELMGISPKNIYRDAQKIGENLMSKVLKLKNSNGWEMFNWLSSMKYIKNEAVIEISLSERILPHIINLKQYTSFKLENILYLGSAHAIKLYQLLANYKKLGTRSIELEELRSILGISEIKSYFEYKNLKRRVIDISMREINAKTDLLVEYSEIKTSRKVTAIKFKITEKLQLEIKKNQKETSSQGKIKIFPSVLEKAKEIVLKAKTGWDLYAIEQQFHDYLEKAGTPDNLEAAFLGFVRKKVSKLA